MGQREEQIKALVLNRVGTCGQCGGGYQLSDVNVLGYKDDLWFLMLVCQQCQQAVGVAAVVKEHSVNPDKSLFVQGRRPGPIDTPTPSLQLAERPATGEPVTIQDVAGIRDFLADFDGNFQRLFSEQP